MTGIDSGVGKGFSVKSLVGTALGFLVGEGDELLVGRWVNNSVEFSFVGFIGETELEISVEGPEGVTVCILVETFFVGAGLGVKIPLGSVVFFWDGIFVEKRLSVGVDVVGIGVLVGCAVGSFVRIGLGFRGFLVGCLGFRGFLVGSVVGDGVGCAVGSFVGFCVG